MSDKKIFVDSNIWLYLLQDDARKKQIALQLLNNKHIVSTQVVAENINVCLRKFKMKHEEVEKHLHFLTDSCELTLITKSTLLRALHLQKRYQFSYYDCLILAAALENECEILYSEDMHHNQILEDSLSIVNPFA